MAEKLQKLLIILPCYNEEETIPVFYREINKLSQEFHEQDFEFLFIDDGSKDNTLSIIKNLSINDNRVHYISFSRNFGKEAAMYAGFCNALGDYVTIIDADLQDPPSLIPEMYKYVSSGEYDSAATRRSNRKGEPPMRSLFAKLFYCIINKISDADIVDGARDFRLMSRKMVNAIVGMSEYNRFSKGIFGWIGFKTKWISYENIERVAGETKWSFWKLLKYSISGIVNFSEAPLMVSSIAGIISCIISIIFVVIIVIRKILFGDPVNGWASLASIILFMGGVQLMCIGVIGQYLAKTYMETKKRPIYIVRETNIDI